MSRHNTTAAVPTGLHGYQKQPLSKLPMSAAFQQIAWKVLGLFGLLCFSVAVGVYGFTFGEHAVLLLGAPLLIPFVVLLFLKPRLLFYLLIVSRCALDPVLDSARFSSTFGLGALLNLLIIACGFLLCIQRTEVPIRRTLMLWIAPLLVMILGTIYSPDVMSALKRLVAFTSYFAVFVIGFILASEGQIKTLVRVILVSAAVPLLVGFYQMATGDLNVEGRLAATFTHPNIYAFYCLLVLIVLLYSQKTQESENTAPISIGSFEKLAKFVMLPCLLIAIVMTQTRSAWVALLILGLIYGIAYSRRLLFFMAAGVVISAFVPAVQDRVMDLFTGNEVVQYAKLNSFAWRQYIWETGLNWMSPSRYLFGYGIGGFFVYSVDFFPMSGGVSFGAHNVFVERFFDGGLLAIGVFSVFFAMQFHAAYELSKQDKFTALIYFGLMLSYLVLNISDNVVDYLAYNWYYWVVAGAMFALARRTDSNNTTP